MVCGRSASRTRNNEIVRLLLTGIIDAPVSIPNLVSVLDEYDFHGECFSERKHKLLGLVGDTLYTHHHHY
jgi:hypothetical protein